MYINCIYVDLTLRGNLNDEDYVGLCCRVVYVTIRFTVISLLFCCSSKQRILYIYNNCLSRYTIEYKTTKD